MQDTSYPVFLNLKIPVLTKTFFCLFFICLVILLVFGVYMFPSEHSSGEMKAAYFVLTTSELEKILFTIGLFGTPIFFFFYKYSRIKRQAILTLLPDKIEIDDFKTVTSFSISEITDIACNDALDRNGYPKEKLTLDFKDKSEQVTSVTLVDYNQSDQVMETILEYKKVRFAVTNFSSNPEVLDM